jgi:hypothetical protein
LVAAINATCFTSLYNYLYTHQNSTAIAVCAYSAFFYPQATSPLSFPVTYNLFFNMTIPDASASALRAKLALDCAILRARSASDASCSVSTRSYPSVPSRVSK